MEIPWFDTVFTRVENLPEDEQGGDMDARMILTHGEGTCVLAYQDFTYQEADVPEPCSWGELADAQGTLEERVSRQLINDYRKGHTS